MTRKEGFQPLDWLIGVSVALAALLLYEATLAPTVLEADSGEFQFVAWLPGIAHPTGYPLYILLGWLWTHIIPFGEVAWRMNLLSAVFAAATVGVTYGLARQMVGLALPETPTVAQVITALGTAATFALTHTFWSQAAVAEVYALHTLFIALVLWLALQLRSADYSLHSLTAKLLTFTFGLSLTHHRTIILLLPALIFFLFYSTRRPASSTSTDEIKALQSRNLMTANFAQSRPSAVVHPDQDRGFSNPLKTFLHLLRSKALALHGVLLVAPLLLYLYLPIIAPHTPYATLTLGDDQNLTLYDNSVKGFWDHIMGTIFTGELQPAAAGLDRFVLAGQLLRQQVGWLGVFLAVSGFVVFWQRKQIDLLLLTGLGSLAFVVFNLIYFIGDVFVLFIPVWLFVAFWIGSGSLGLAHGLASRFTRGKATSGERLFFKAMGEPLEKRIYRLLVVSGVALLMLLLVALLTIQNVEVSQTHNTTARARWLEILAEPLPEKAVLLSNDRNEIMPMWYYQYVEQRRPDLQGLFPLIVADPAYANVGRVLDQALASGRPVFLIKPMAGLSLKADLTPVNALYQATAPTISPANPLDITLPEIIFTSPSNESRSERIKLIGYDVEPAQVRPGQAVTVTLYWQTIQELSIDYTSYVHLIDGQGRGLAQNDAQPGGDFYPSSRWQPGEILRDRHRLSIPGNLAPGAYRFRVGMYYQPEPDVFAGMGAGEVIGHLTIF